MRRWIWRAGVVAAVALIGVGSFAAYRGYTRTSSPQDVVHGYLAALERADAPAALAAGDIPAGSRTFLTSTVLAVQQRRAPIHDIEILGTTHDGDSAAVQVRYARGRSTVRDTVALHRHDGVWRLDRVAVATTLRVAPATDRATLFGAPVPTASVLLFPGALPIEFDTSALQLAPGHDAITLGADQTTQVPVQLSDAGHRAVQGEVLAALRRCLDGQGSDNCPVPGARYVPGTLRGTITGHPALTTKLRSARAGVVDVEGTVAVDARYRRLTFENMAAPGHGSVDVEVHAALYAVRPAVVVWSRA